MANSVDGNIIKTIGGFMKKTEKELTIEKAKTYIVFSQFKAGFLMMKGFKLHDMEKNKDFPNKNVFFFSNIDPLHEALKDLDNRNKEINELIGG